MRLSKIFAPLLLAGTTALGACATHAYIADDAPPPAREEVVAYQPGQVWVHGHWDRRGSHWAWTDGHYERERPGYVYVEGRWQQNGDQHVWVRGGWHRRGEGISRR